VSDPARERVEGAAGQVAEVAGAVRAMLRTGRRPELPPELADDATLGELLDQLDQVIAFASAIARGDLDETLAVKGSLAGSLKTLHAALRHLTWQTERIAAGDLSQKVDFMGAFSRAFNSMTLALDEARRELDQRNQELEAAVRRNEELATTDVLTGAYNRRKFNDVVAVELERARRYGLPLSLFILDIDHFKNVNDTHGHEAGDAVLTALAGLVRDGVRATDTLARWGGEEFVVLSPGVTAEGAANLAERIRAALASGPVAPVGVITASFGVTQYRQGESADELFARADRALYLAKESGRDRVEIGD
jgi:diguanylate cyclase (GGDEF)-like protein